MNSKLKQKKNQKYQKIRNRNKNKEKFVSICLFWQLVSDEQQNQLNFYG